MISSQDPKLIEEYNRILSKYENKYAIKKTYFKIINEINQLIELNQLNETNQPHELDEPPELDQPNQQLMNLLQNIHPTYNIIQSMLFPNVQLYIFQIPQ